MYYHWQTIWGGGGEAGLLGGEASPLPPPVDRTLAEDLKLIQIDHAKAFESHL